MCLLILAINNFSTKGTLIFFYQHLALISTITQKLMKSATLSMSKNYFNIVNYKQ